MSSFSTLRLLSILLCLLLASGCDVAAVGDDSMTIRVTAQDVNSGVRLPNTRVGIGYPRLGFTSTPGVDWIETSHTDEFGTVVFELAACERSSLVVNAFGATAADRGVYGPRQESIPCEPGEHSVILEMAQY